MRMVIRNGFGRAMATIIDTHSTTIITGVILYIIGTEQLRGFAVTLVMGLVVNLFTAVFCARVVFDIAERKRWLTELKMLKLFGETKIDFVSIMKPAIVVSILISVAGLWRCGSEGERFSTSISPAAAKSRSRSIQTKRWTCRPCARSWKKPSVAAKLPDVTVNAVTSASVTGEHAVHHPHVERQPEECRSGAGCGVRRTPAALSTGQANRSACDRSERCRGRKTGRTTGHRVHQAGRANVNHDNVSAGDDNHNSSSGHDDDETGPFSHIVDLAVESAKVGRQSAGAWED